MSAVACPAMVTDEKPVELVDGESHKKPLEMVDGELVERFLAELRAWIENLPMVCDNPDYANPKEFVFNIINQAGKIMRLAKLGDPLREDIWGASLQIAMSAFFAYVGRKKL